MTLTIKTLSKEDLQTVIDWAKIEGWNPGKEDTEAFFAADDQGFFGGQLDGTLVNAISAVKYGDKFGFIGLYICRPEHRGKGYGHKIWEHAMAYLGDCVIGLDAVKEQMASYAQHGFKPVYRNIRYAGMSSCRSPFDQRIVPLTNDVADSIADYDTSFFPGPRSGFLRNWIDPKSSTRSGFAFLEDKKVKGYGVLRQCDEGYKIGPLFAETPEIAESLFQALAGKVAGQTVILDLPEPNSAAVLLAERHELTPEFETFRMYRGAVPDLPLDQMYGITTFELG